MVMDITRKPRPQMSRGDLLHPEDPGSPQNEYVQIWRCPECRFEVRAVLCLLAAVPGNVFPWWYSGGYVIDDFKCSNLRGG